MPPTISVDDATYQEVAFIASVSGVEPGDIVRKLLDRHRVSPTKDSLEKLSTPVAGDGLVLIHASYGRPKRSFEALFDQSNQHVTVMTGTHAGETFDSPSRAAMAVVKEANPSRQRPETNGWLFWTVTETGNLLDSLR